MGSSEEILKDVQFNMDKTVSLFDGMAKEYHNPTNFIASADALIQSLRNFTFFLQSKKNEIPEFEQWYKPWQALMKENPYMRFIVDMRNSIVKQGINSTDSHALVVLYTDYRQTLLEKKLDIYKTTDEIKKEIEELAKKKPYLNHSTGDIHRTYIFNYKKKDDLEVFDTLFYCTFFIQRLFEDFKRYMKDGDIKTELPKVIAPWVDTSNFIITFKAVDGSNLKMTTKTIKGDEKLIKEMKKIYGDFKPKYDINSKDPNEQLKANIEVAQASRSKFDELLPILKFYSTKTGEWETAFPLLKSRAEKILFWENFSNVVRERGIDKLYLTVDAWTYKDVEKGIDTIQSGKEVNTLPDLGETLISHYLESSGKTLVAKCPYKFSDTGEIIYDEVEIKSINPEDYAMFTAVYQAWGVELNIDAV